MIIKANNVVRIALPLKAKIAVSMVALAVLTACSTEQTSAQEDKTVNEIKPTAAQLKEMADKSRISPEKTIKPKSEGRKMHRREQITAARTLLMEHKKLSTPNEVKLISAKPVTWRSGALGCPKPGVIYTQALVKGMLIILAAGDEHYRFHAAADGEPFYCAKSNAESPIAEPSDI